MKLKKTMMLAALAALLFGCVKSPNMERVAEETKKGLEASWAGKGVCNRTERTNIPERFP